MIRLPLFFPVGVDLLLEFPVLLRLCAIVGFIYSRNRESCARDELLIRGSDEPASEGVSPPIGPVGS